MKFVFSIVFGMAVYALNWVAVFTGIYAKWEWFDMPMHVLGGMVAAAVAFGVIDLMVEKVTLRKRVKNHRWLWDFIVVIGIVSTIAIVWELHEFLIDSLRFGSFYEQLYNERVAGYHQPSITDTMIDFTLGILGGIVYFVLVTFYEKNTRR